MNLNLNLTPNQIKTICAWCDTLLVDGCTDKGISHGICSPCKDRMMNDYKSSRATTLLTIKN